MLGRVTRFGGVALGAPLIALLVWAGGAHRAVAEGDAPPAATYLGAQSCKKCHLKQFKSWSETKMAKGFNSLKPGEAKESKEKAKLDVTKDYTKEEACVKCHTTGYGLPGGYPKIGDPAADATLASEREGLQCEICHGPGSNYSPYMKDHEKDYNKDEAKKLGLILPDGSACTNCHKGGPDGSPVVPADFKFDGAAKIKEKGATHDHFKK